MKPVSRNEHSNRMGKQRISNQVIMTSKKSLLMQDKRKRISVLFIIPSEIMLKKCFYLRKNLFPFRGSLHYRCSRNSHQCLYNPHYGKHQETLHTRWRLQHPCEMKKVLRILMKIIWSSLPFVSKFVIITCNYSTYM